MRGDSTIKSAVSREYVDKVILLRRQSPAGKNGVIGMRENLRKAIKKFEKPWIALSGRSRRWITDGILYTAWLI